MRTVLRRSGRAQPSARDGGHWKDEADGRERACRFAGWRFDPGERTLAAPDGRSIDLTRGEFDLLQAFVEAPRRTLTREMLMDRAKGRDYEAFDRAVDVQVARLRKKIEGDPKTPSLIKSVRGVGYYFAANVERNGHHYVHGMADPPAAGQRAFLDAHPDLYREVAGSACLRIEDGELAIGSLDCAGFASAAEPAWDDMRSF